MGVAIFILLFCFPSLLLLIEAVHQIEMKRKYLNENLVFFLSIFFIVLNTLLFRAFFDSDNQNDCCSINPPFFSPDHRISIYILILLCSASYFYSSLRSNIAAPLLELVVNCFLITGIVLNILIAIHLKDEFFIGLSSIISNISLFLIELSKNHTLLLEEINSIEASVLSLFQKNVLVLLKTPWFVKFPLLLIISLPLLVILASVLLLFGQKPDSFMRAFTDTYKHGFSQLDYLCDNVSCGGHYLCSVAANGHEKVVKPIRTGERGGGKIICNRQLLISNAFEEVIEERFPALHRFIRRNYDKMGDLIHRNYKLFSNRYFSDAIYYLMKPLEWIFLIVIYLVDRKPENRIASQYLSAKDRISIKQHVKGNFF